MSEVLSQSQIDALLSAVRSGETDAAKPKEPEKFRKYDFSSPRKFTKDRIKLLNGIFENYSRIINSRLNAILRTSCDISVESIEEQRYYEFSNALTEGDVLGLVDVDVNGRRQEASVMYYISTETALGMMDRMMGGEDNGAPSIHSGYKYTDLELRLYEDLGSDLFSVLGNSWSSYLPVDFTFRKVDENPTLNQTQSIDEIVVIVDMKVQFAEVIGRMSICLPSELLMVIFDQISRENPARRLDLEDRSDDILDHIRDSNLDVVAEMAETQLSLRDLYNLNEGDVIDLGCGKDSDIYLKIGGYRWFSGRLGTHEKNIAVMIDEVCDETEQRSE